MSGFMIFFIAICYLVINAIWLWLHYDEEYTLSIPNCIYNVIVFVLGILLFLFADNGWKDFGLISLLNSVSYFVSFIIALILQKFSFYDYDESHMGLFCASYGLAIGIVIIFYIIIPYSNIVSIETPTIENKYYELLSGSSVQSDGNDEDILFYIPSNAGNYYMFYYAMENEYGEIAAVPYKIAENQVELIIASNGVEAANSDYLLETITTYYQEDRNKEPAEKIVLSSKKECKLYISESTLKNMIVATDS